MLIVNADDLGRARIATDRALSCFAKRRIASTSAMVFMEDSERAADLALEAGIDVGLHINLSERFSGRYVPAPLRDRHERICRFLSAHKYALLFYHPLLSGAFRYVFAVQYDEFMRLYGKLPSHLDGHQHMHLATNMLVQGVLPAGAKVRRSFSFQAGEKSLINRWYRSMVDRTLARRHRLADYFVSLSHNLTLDRLDRLILLAQKANIELMAHPQNHNEYEFLMSEGYWQAMSRVELASYAAL